VVCNDGVFLGERRVLSELKAKGGGRYKEAEDRPMKGKGRDGRKD